MSVEFPAVPAGSGKHAVAFVVLSANKLAESRAFYSGVLDWKLNPMSAELAIGTAPSGPSLTLRANIPEGTQTLVPFIGVPDVEAALARVVAAGGTVERAPWSLPMIGTLARFKDPSGTVYGLTAAAASQPRIPAPFGANPKPQAGSICSLEMYAADGEAAGRFFGGLFGWSALPTMPQYMAFDPGAGVGGVFQSHTPALQGVAYFYVQDVDATLARIDAAGGKRMGDAMSVPGLARFGYFADPSGTTMGLIGE
jgi:predicted enzyme related to lactoylglutathione lyase